nr:unnamed protein product [Naegleria fowleri]
MLKFHCRSSSCASLLTPSSKLNTTIVLKRNISPHHHQDWNSINFNTNHRHDYLGVISSNYNYSEREFHHLSAITHSSSQNSEVVTRFAPSPTGFMHLGALRTSLFNYLFARKHGGKFLLRIEDTDQKRLVPGSIEQIQNTLKWAHLSYDPLVISDPSTNTTKIIDFAIQSQRNEIYQEHVQILLDKGYAYKCYCTEERLEEVRSIRGPSKYDRHCLNLSEEEKEEFSKKGNGKFTIRMKVPDHIQYTVFEDQVYGKIKIENKTVDDQVLMKSDGTPTYHLANVVDDHVMEVTHVIRGQEWISSTPKHCILYDMFGWERPKFAHLPLLCNEDGSKLSKRQGHASVDYYMNLGYLPEALINFVALLGWHPGTNDEIFTLDELTQKFELSRINKGNCKVDLAKLEWINSQHIRMNIEKDMDGFIELLRPHLALSGIPVDEYLRKVLYIGRERIKRVPDFVDFFNYFFYDVKLDTPEAVELLESIEKKVPDHASVARKIRDELVKIDKANWKEESIAKVISDFVQNNKEQVKAYGNVVFILRYYLTGKKIGPNITQIIETLDRDVVLSRLAV